jgi:hypothetical protein
MGRMKPSGAPLSCALSLKLYCVLAMQMGSAEKPWRAWRSISASACGL